MEKKEKVSAKAQVKVEKSVGAFIAVKGFDLENGKRYEIGDKVSALAPEIIEALQEMEAIKEDGE